MPPAPKGFGKHSLRLWELGEELIKQNVLTKPDLVNFELFCVVYGRVMAFNEHIQKDPLNNVEGEHGGRSAQAQQMNADMGLLLKLSNEFGLTPASRNKFGITKKKEEDPDIKKMRGLIGA
jgi:P27 family predicted phage terminase small subunit